MTRKKILCKGLISLILTAIAFSSCNYNSSTIPFPEKELGYSQPVSVPLQFSETKKLSWDTAKKGGVKPVIKKLDLDKLPVLPFDSNGFRDFGKPPEVVKIDLNNLPDTVFNLEGLPAKSLQFKTSLVSLSPPIKSSSPSVQKGNPLSIYDFGPKHGLPAKFVTCLLKDKNGLMWIASAEGLFRYDGEHIQTFIPGPVSAAAVGMMEDDYGRIWFIQAGSVGMIDPKKGTISFTPSISVDANNLSKMIRDENGQIWISKTVSKAVIIIDPVTLTFKSLDRSAGLSDSGRGANDIAEDENGNLWITTPFGGMNIINQKSKKIQYLNKANGLSTDSLRAITKDKDGQIWVGLIGGRVDAVNLKQGTITRYNAGQGLRPAFIGDISSDDKGFIWIGKNIGVDVLDPKKGRKRFIDDTSGLAAKWVASCTMDSYNRMWVATVGGISIIDQHAETVNPVGITNVISLMEDTVGNLWVATQQGILILNAEKKVKRRLDKSLGLGDDFVQSFTKFNQQIWVTTNGGLDIVDPIRKTIEHTGKKEGLVNDSIYVVLKDKDGNTWLTGPSNGVDLIDAAKKVILHTEVSGGLSDNTILDVKQDHDGLVWLATNTRGVNVVDMQKGTVQYLDNQPGLRDTCSKMMLTDKYGRIWIGTDKGIYVVDKKLGTITPINTAHGLSDNHVLSLLEYKESVIAGNFTKVNIITAPVPDYAGKSKDTSASEWKVSLLDKSESLTREATNAWSTDAITNKGQFLWGDNGIAIINEIKADSIEVATYITGMSVMNKLQHFVNTPVLNENDTIWYADTFFIKGRAPANAGFGALKEFSWDSVSGAYNMPVNLSIPFNKNYIQFRFAQANLSRQDNVSYTYLLEGIDKNWSNITSNTLTENYLNLPPGDYAFKVSSKGKNDQWGVPAVFNFTIAPPWYNTWWAYTLLALLGIGILRIYIVYRSRRLKQENKLLEEKVELRTKQLQQSLENLKATQTQLIQSEKMASLGELTAGIAHEIQNPLNFVNNFSEVNAELIDEMKQEIAKGNASEIDAIADEIKANNEKITHHGQRADAIVKGMLQHTRVSSGQKELTDINALADEYLRLAYHGLRAKDKSFNAKFETDLDPQLGRININPQEMGRVLLNLINNAFYAVNEKKKKTGNGYDPAVNVSIKKRGDKAEIRVMDNGMGVPQKVVDKIFQPFFTTKPVGQGTGLGLSLSYDVIKAHGGEINLETKEGEGAVFIIQLPIN